MSTETHDLRINVEETSVCATLFHGGAAVSIVDAVRYEGETWLLTRINVHRDFRRQGNGSALLTEVASRLRRQGALSLIVAPGGYDTPPEVQQAFFTSLGFSSSPSGYLELPLEAP